MMHCNILLIFTVKLKLLLKSYFFMIIDFRCKSLLISAILHCEVVFARLDIVFCYNRSIVVHEVSSKSTEWEYLLKLKYTSSLTVLEYLNMVTRFQFRCKCNSNWTFSHEFNKKKFNIFTILNCKHWRYATVNKKSIKMTEFNQPMWK